MPATSVVNVLTQVRAQLREKKARYWTDDELAAIMDLGQTDLWGAILDLHQDHYLKIDAENVVLKADAEELSGVPDDCFRVQLIEPRDTSVTVAGHQIIFTPMKYKEPAFAVARTQTSADPSSFPARQIYYQITGVGSPIEPPHILTAPKLSSDLNIRLVFNPSLEKLDAKNYIQVPGGADNALKAWTIAYAMAKENEANQPDAGWLGIYATEKQNILVRLTPREEQEPEVVEDLFQGFGSLW